MLSEMTMKRKLIGMELKRCCFFIPSLKKIESTIKVNSAILLKESGLLKTKSFESYKL